MTRKKAVRKKAARSKAPQKNKRQPVAKNKSKAGAARKPKAAAKSKSKPAARKGSTATAKVIDAGRAESGKYIPDDEVEHEFQDAQRLAAGSGQFMRKLRVHHSKTPELAGGDVDAAWDQADAGEETVGGSSPTPDQDVVDELGEAVGLTYEDNEPLHTTEKLEQRDRNRWDLDPASSEDYQERTNPARRRKR